MMKIKENSEKENVKKAQIKDPVFRFLPSCSGQRHQSSLDSPLFADDAHELERLPCASYVCVRGAVQWVCSVMRAIRAIWAARANDHHRANPPCSRPLAMMRDTRRISRAYLRL